MNYKMIAYTLGRMIVTEACLLLLPLVVALLYSESVYLAFLLTIGIAILIGLPLLLFCKPQNPALYAKEGLVIAALAWLVFSVIGALPFVISGEVPRFVDAFFETVSGLTTTGASILNDVEALSHGLLFWRSFTNWIGGMGVLVFLFAIVSGSSGRFMHILRAEMPGPIVGKLVPRVKDTAKILYMIYIALTGILVIFLVCGGMPVFESFLHAFATAGTGGFSAKADGFVSYSPYIQWVITIFMLLFGVNFNLYYFLLIRHFRSAFKNRELWTYIGIVIVSVACITLDTLPLFSGFSETVRHAAFQVSSIITTTGFATTDFALWSDFSKAVLLLLMFIGGCAGSTAGGLKVSRALILSRVIRREIRHVLHPRSVSTVKLDGKQLDEPTLSGINTYFALYITCIAAVFLILSFEPFGFETNFSAAVSCFNNIGPGLGAVGPMSNYAAYSDLSKYVLSFAMLLGRLEIYPLLLAFLPATWKRG